MMIWILVQLEQDDPSTVLSVHRSEAGARAKLAGFSALKQQDLEVQGPFTCEE
jgi:hypothetical protein